MTFLKKILGGNRLGKKVGLFGKGFAKGLGQGVGLVGKPLAGTLGDVLQGKTPDLEKRGRQLLGAEREIGRRAIGALRSARRRR